ncbi:heavy-metal-associated domain-containing protein [Halomarina ordinaria]|uniref:Heavy-metal-associated domain-containing protein n=1 Tax=Halomarina ordinaria TaxID=3033939 RepID=A0ABD5UD45_9EURY|nr:heavy-metal-associated domain-containing protein [Halomarina sp. PSRA2]
MILGTNSRESLPGFDINCQDDMDSIATVPVTDTVFECDNCENTIVTVLEGTAGVDGVSIETDDRVLSIAYDPETTTDEELHDLVETWGYAPE